MFYKLSSLLAVALVLLCISDVNEAQAYQRQRARLRDIQTLSLTHGKWTTGQRTRPVPQLQCVGGSARCAHLPKTVQCYNRGTDGVDIQWECKADMDTNLRFGNIEVTCEGFEYPEDDYILVGSCGLEYTIDLVDPHNPPKKDYFKPPSNHPHHRKNETGPGSLIFVIVVVGAIAIIYMSCLRKPSTEEETRRAYPNPSAPPPPGFRTDFFGGNHQSTGDYGTHAGTAPRPTGSRFGGFWSGLGMGGLGGYLFGRRGNRPNYTDQSSYFSGSRPQQQSSFFGNTFGGSSNASHDSTPPPSSGTHVSSGFGGTKRR